MTALEKLVSAIEATGGLVETPKGHLVPVADEEWLDLADAYVEACRELGKEPLITRKEG